MIENASRRGHSGTEGGGGGGGGAPALRISRKKGSFFKTSSCPRFCKRRVLYCTQVRSMGVKIPLQSTKYTRLWRRVTPEVTGLPSLQRQNFSFCRPHLSHRTRLVPKPEYYTPHVINIFSIPRSLWNPYIWKLNTLVSILWHYLSYSYSSTCICSPRSRLLIDLLCCQATHEEVGRKSYG